MTSSRKRKSRVADAEGEVFKEFGSPLSEGAADWRRTAKVTNVGDLVAEIESQNKDENRRKARGDWLDVLHTWHIKTGNPLHVWAAIKYCADKQLAFPTWTIEYLVNSASDLLEIGRTTRPKDAANAAMKALRLSLRTGKESPFEEFQRATRRERVCVGFARRILSGAVYKQAVFDAANEGNISPQTVDLWLRDFFPSKQGDRETWPDFFRRKTDHQGPDYDKLLASLLYS